MKRFLGFLAFLLVLALGAAGYAYWAVSRSLPPAHERLALGAAWPADLGDSVAIDYDAHGVPTIHGASEQAVAFGQGYAHARDRRFQMELNRRAAAGRLAELFGPVALPSDRLTRTLGFAGVAERAWTGMSPRRRGLATAYAAGVNAWDAHHPPAPEFLLFGGRPEPWRPQDCTLVQLLMMYDLSWDQADEERACELMDATLAPALVAFLRPVATPWDLPLDGSAVVPPPPLPTAAQVNLRLAGAAQAPPRGPAPDPARGRARVPTAAADTRVAIVTDRHDLGSNNWAIAPARTATGGALVAGDPHLTLRVPVIWHRQRIEGGGLHATGITLPGIHGIVFGTNGAVAWTGTNVEGDFVDLVRCRFAPGDTTRYLGPAGPEPFGDRREVIRVQGQAAETLRVRTTRFGPVIARSAHAGAVLAAQWTALDPAVGDTDLYPFARARNAREFLTAIAGYRGPQLNFVFGDTAGTVGWIVGGPLPRRAGFDPARPRPAEDGAAGWHGWLSPAEAPALVAPWPGFVATANQRTVGGELWARVGGMPALPWRARRIVQQVGSRGGWTVAACESLQNDVDDAFLIPYAGALRRALAAGTGAAGGRAHGAQRVRGAAGDPADDAAAETTLVEVAHVLARWEHRADSTSAAHAFLRQFRTETNQLLLEPLVAACQRADSTFEYDWSLSDEVVRRLLEERPAHLLSPGYEDYDELLRDAAVRAADALRARAPGTPLAGIAWGRVNRAAVEHPLGAVFGPLGGWLNMPRAALSGGSNVVRVARPRAGASMRMVVDLADPARSSFALPGGQSGHFLSPNYKDGFADWVAGRTVALEPGPAAGRVVLLRGSAR